MKFTNQEPLKVPRSWKQLLAKKTLEPQEQNDCRPVDGSICEEILFSVNLVSDDRHYWLAVTVDDSLNDVHLDTEADNGYAIDAPILVEKAGNAYAINLALA